MGCFGQPTAGPAHVEGSPPVCAPRSLPCLLPRSALTMHSPLLLHPIHALTCCSFQIMADILTVKEHIGRYEDVKVRASSSGRGRQQHRLCDSSSSGCAAAAAQWEPPARAPSFSAAAALGT